MIYKPHFEIINTMPVKEKIKEQLRKLLAEYDLQDAKDALESLLKEHRNNSRRTIDDKVNAFKSKLHVHTKVDNDRPDLIALKNG